MSPSQAPSPATGPQLWSPFVFALAGTICTIFMLLSYYWVLKGHCCTFHGMTFSGNRQLLNEDNPENPSLQFQSRGLDSYIMHALPITQFNRKNEGEELGGQSNRDCAVCLGEYEEGEWVKQLPNCSHSFHVSCIDTWFQAHSSCPLCRSYVSDLAKMQNEDSVSMYSLLETLRRDEDFLHDGSAHSEVIHSRIPLNSLPAIDP